MFEGKKLLFLTWDSDQTQYLEGLFLPIFNLLSKKTGLQIHIVQCSWANKEKVAYLQEHCAHQDIAYHHIAINRKPHPLMGSIISVHMAGKLLIQYCKDQDIDFLMPRSTMPTWIVNRIFSSLPQKVKLVMDADGLPIEERVDFAGLKKGGYMYRFLKNIEKKGLNHADSILCRSQKAIDFLCRQHQIASKDKFHRIVNGRDAGLFSPSLELREKIRSELQLLQEEKLMVYAGSLGPQYCINEMFELIARGAQSFPLKALILSGNPSYLEHKIPVQIQDIVMVKKVKPQEVPKYLNAADLAFALREPKLSMMGVAPIKLGEYLLMGIPTIASKGIGDTEEILNNEPACHLFDHEDPERMEKALHFMGREHPEKERLRNLGLENFSLQASVDSYLKALKPIC